MFIRGWRHGTGGAASARCVSELLELGELREYGEVDTVGVPGEDVAPTLYMSNQCLDATNGDDWARG